MHTMIMIHIIQLSRINKVIARNRQKNFREGSQHNMNGLRSSSSLPGPLGRSPYIPVCVCAGGQPLYQRAMVSDLLRCPSFSYSLAGGDRVAAWLSPTKLHAVD